MHQFFTRAHFADTPLVLKPNTYKVGVGCGVILQANKEYQYLYTGGLRTCIAFALINTAAETALLIHFFHPSQINDEVQSMVSAFLERALKHEEGIICLIAGGRAFHDHSELMCAKLIDFAHNHLSHLSQPLKLRLNAPIVADDEETLSILIDLRTGESQMVLREETEESGDIPFAVEHIKFTNLTVATEKRYTP